MHVPSATGFASQGHQWLPSPVPAGLTPPAAPSPMDGPHAWQCTETPHRNTGHGWKNGGEGRGVKATGETAMEWLTGWC